MPSSPSPGAPADAPLSLGIDIGGTFTDIVVIDPSSGNAVIWKESTTPDDPARGTMLGLWKLVERSGIVLERIGRVIHATTLFTNALIERKGAPTGLITTAGFADVLEIGRERKYELYDIFLEMPPPLVPRPWRREVPERLAPDGTVEIPLDVTALLREAQELVADGVRSLAICFLHAYANPAHERTAAAAIAQHFPDLSLSLSSDIAPEMREYPRMVTTVANAYVRPLAETYLDHLEAALHGAGIPGSLFLMLSNGGLTHVAEAKRAPVQLLESSPAAGALAGAWFSRQAGLDRVLAFDMGGTTAKLALVEDGEPLVTWGFEAARQKRFLHGSGFADPDRDGRTHRDRRRRRLDCPAEHSRHPACRAGKRRRAAGSGLLRPRRHTANSHRRRPRIGLSECRVLPRRHDVDRCESRDDGFGPRLRRTRA
jgi:N-methylhydantoinase A